MDRTKFCSSQLIHPLDHDKDEFRAAQCKVWPQQEIWVKAEKGDDDLAGLLWKRMKDRTWKRDPPIEHAGTASNTCLVFGIQVWSLGQDKTMMRALDEDYWPVVHSDVRRLCAACPECPKGSLQKPKKAPLHLLLAIDEPFTRIGMDLVGTLLHTEQENRHILDVVTMLHKRFQMFQ